MKRDLRSTEVRELVNFSEKCDLKINTPLWNPVCENVRRAKWAKISNKCKDSKNVSNKLLWIAIAWPAIAKSFCSYMLIKVVFNPSCPVYISQQVLDSRVLAWLFTVFYVKRVSCSTLKIWKLPVKESFFSNVAGLKPTILLKMDSITARLPWYFSRYCN